MSELNTRSSICENKTIIEFRWTVHAAVLNIHGPLGEEYCAALQKEEEFYGSTVFIGGAAKVY